MISVYMARKRSSLGFVFWLGLMLLVLLVFVFSRPTIGRVLDSTDFFAAVRPSDSSPVVVVRPSAETPLTRTGHDTTTEEPKRQENTKTQSELSKATTSDHTLTSQSEPSTPDPAADHTTRVFFVSLTDNGEIELRGVERKIGTDETPLASIVRALLAGPTASEERRNIISLIPKEVKLHQTAVQDSTAIIDLDQAFRFNSLGREGLLARLRQLVYSATEIPTIDAVQILIDGDNVDYLGPEGLYIGKPLTRESFDS